MDIFAATAAGIRGKVETRGPIWVRNARLVKSWYTRTIRDLWTAQIQTLTKITTTLASRIWVTCARSAGDLVATVGNDDGSIYHAYACYINCISVTYYMYVISIVLCIIECVSCRWWIHVNSCSVDTMARVFIDRVLPCTPHTCMLIRTRRHYNIHAFAVYSLRTYSYTCMNTHHQLPTNCMH